jgi:DNA polymerase V
MIKAANKALQEIFQRGCGYKKAGVIATGIIPKDSIQANIFDTTDHSRHSKIMQAIDKINSSIGNDTVIIASQKFSEVKMRHEHRSPRYTTSWDDIPTVTVK